MPISEKTRKLLWGRSGNRCAVCRQELVIDATNASDDSVVGDECHIVSGASRGPRHDSGMHIGELDAAENLILLCRVHHKMVDDQYETYTVQALRTLRNNHENWVSSTLGQKNGRPQVRFVRIKANIPTHLARVRSGADLFSLVGGACAGSYDHDGLRSEEEVDLVARVLEEAKEFGESSSDDEVGQHVKQSYRMTGLIRELEDAGLWLFGAREVQRLEGGDAGPAAWPVCYLRVIRADSPEIIKIDLGGSNAADIAIAPLSSDRDGDGGDV